MDLYQKFDHDIFDVTKIMLGISLTDGQKAELAKIAGEIDAAYCSGQLTAHERSRLLSAIKDCGMELLPIKKNECPRNLPKRKTRGHDR